MNGIICRRFFHVSKINMYAMKNSALAKLRKSTGYSMSNCKAALGLFPDDINKAEHWLHEEAKQKGWYKWAKIQKRTATQGIICAYSKNNIGAMLEVNCETDFVAKNADFQKFVENVLSSCLNHINECNMDEEIIKISLDETQLNSLKFESSSVGELIGDITCKFNEKTVTKRAVCYKVKDDIFLSCISHPGSSSPNLPGGTFGKYGALLAYRRKKINADVNLKDFGFNICQHIIGMNPLSLGEFTELHMLEQQLTAQKLCDEGDKNMHACNEEENKNQDDEQALTAQKLCADERIHVDAYSDEDKNQDDDEAEFSSDIGSKDVNEKRLLFQPFLIEPNITVGETVLNSSIEILQFERYECGESDIQELETVSQAV